MSLLSTSNFEGKSFTEKGISAFLVRIFTFLFPFIIVGLAMELVLWKTGDLWTPHYALMQQQRSVSESIYGPRFFSDQFNVYKLSAIEFRNPSILIIGSSRVMHFRDIMFHPLEKEFYNGGGILRNAFDLEAFADKLVRGELPLPKVLIVGLDPWWLRMNYGTTTWFNESDEHFSFAGHIEAFRQILKKGALKKVISATVVSEVPGFGHDAIGTSARMEGNGFRKDGSNLYPLNVFLDFVKTPLYVDRESPPIIDRIQMTRREYSLPAVVDSVRVRLVVEALSLIKSKGVEVVAFMPPYSTEAFEALERSRPLRLWWNFYKNDFPELLDQHDIVVLPVSHPQQFGLDDTYMFDGFHPSEVYIAHLVKYLIEIVPNSSYLKNVELGDLMKTIQNAAIPLAFDLPITSSVVMPP